MQLDIVLKKEKIILPICTSATIQGLLYNALKIDYEYSTNVHNFGNKSEGRNFKQFTFSELQGKYVIEDNNIIFLDKTRLSVRAADAYLIQLLFTCFSKNKFMTLAGQKVEVSDLQLKDNHIYKNEIVVKTLSPITVYITEQNGHTIYFSPYDEDFYSGIISNAKRKWISLYGSDESFKLEITPIKEKGFIKRATRFKDTFITAWHGTFKLTAPPEVLNFLYNTGIGSKNSQGFGMFEVVDSENIQDL